MAGSGHCSQSFENQQKKKERRRQKKNARWAALFNSDSADESSAVYYELQPEKIPKYFLQDVKRIYGGQTEHSEVNIKDGPKWSQRSQLGGATKFTIVIKFVRCRLLPCAAKPTITPGDFAWPTTGWPRLWAETPLPNTVRIQGSWLKIRQKVLRPAERNYTAKKIPCTTSSSPPYHTANLWVRRY